MDFATLTYLYKTHAWTALFVLVIGYLVQLTSKESKFPVQISPRWKPLVVAVLALLLTGGQAIAGGLPWRDVVLRGLATGFLTMGLFDLCVNAFLNGRIPAWLATLAAMTPQPPPPPSEKAISIKPPAGAVVEVTIPDDRPTTPALDSKGDSK